MKSNSHTVHCSFLGTREDNAFHTFIVSCGQVSCLSEIGTEAVCVISRRNVQKLTHDSLPPLSSAAGLAMVWMEGPAWVLRCT